MAHPRQHLILFLIAACLPSASLAAENPDAILGVWETEQKEPGDPYSRIEVVEKDGKFSGTIVWLSDPVYEEGDPEAGKLIRDRDNPDAKLQGRPLIGLSMMHGFEFHQRDGKWVDGRIYDPEAGKEYNCKLTLKDPDTLEVFGYMKVGFVKLGRDTIWKRVP